MSTKKHFENLSLEEIVDAYVLPSELEGSDHAEAESTFVELINKRRKERSPVEDLKFKLMRFKFEMDDFVNSDQLNGACSFGYFLKQYLEIIGKNQKDFADDLDISRYQLNHYLQDRRATNDSLIMRLEIHSNNIISSLNWLKVVEKQNAYSLINNKSLRKAESKHVSNKLQVEL